MINIVNIQLIEYLNFLITIQTKFWMIEESVKRHISHLKNQILLKKTTHPLKDLANLIDNYNPRAK
jgi:hypothetical protein